MAEGGIPGLCRWIRDWSASTGSGRSHGPKHLLIDMTKEDIRDNFIEFNKYRDNCLYSDCMHIKEDNCSIKEMVNNGTIINSRYDNYLKFISAKEKENNRY